MSAWLLVVMDRQGVRFAEARPGSRVVLVVVERLAQALPGEGLEPRWPPARASSSVDRSSRTPSRVLPSATKARSDVQPHADRFEALATRGVQRQGLAVALDRRGEPPLVVEAPGQRVQGHCREPVQGLAARDHVGLLRLELAEEIVSQIAVDIGQASRACACSSGVSQSAARNACATPARPARACPACATRWRG